MRPRLEGPSDSQIYRVTEAKLFVPVIWLRVRNTTAPSCATSGRRGVLPCGHPGPAGAGAPRPAAAAWQQAQGLLHNRAHGGPGTARVRENRKPISVDELFMADTDLTEPPPPLEE